MDRLQAIWLHQKFCKSRATITNVDEPTGVITEAICGYCMLSLWKVGDDTPHAVIIGAEGPEHYYLTTSGDYDPLLGLCDLCDEQSIFARTDVRLCKTHFERAKMFQPRRAGEKCIMTDECKRDVAYGSRDRFVKLCRSHFKEAMVLNTRRMQGQART